MVADQDFSHLGGRCSGSGHVSEKILKEGKREISKKGIERKVQAYYIWRQQSASHASTGILKTKGKSGGFRAKFKIHCAKETRPVCNWRLKGWGYVSNAAGRSWAVVVDVLPLLLAISGMHA